MTDFSVLESILSPSINDELLINKLSNDNFENEFDSDNWLITGCAQFCGCKTKLILMNVMGTSGETTVTNTISFSGEITFCFDFCSNYSYSLNIIKFFTKINTNSKVYHAEYRTPITINVVEDDVFTFGLEFVSTSHIYHFYVNKFGFTYDTQTQYKIKVGDFMDKIADKVKIKLSKRCHSYSNNYCESQDPCTMIFNNRQISDSTELTNSDQIIFVNTTTGDVNPITITLPTAGLFVNKMLYILDRTGHASENNITILRQMPSLISGEESVVLSVNYEKIQLYCDGENFYVL